MNIKHIIIILSLIVESATLLCAKSIGTEQALHELDQLIVDRQQYIKLRQNRIDSIRLILSHDGLSPDEWVSIGDLYASFNNDSALCCYSRALDAATDDTTKTLCRIKLSSRLPVAGLAAEALDMYGTIVPSNLSDELLDIYFNSSRDMAYFMQVLYGDIAPQDSQWIDKRRLYQSKILEGLDPDNHEYGIYAGELAFLNNEYLLADSLLENEFLACKESNPHRAQIAHMLSRINMNLGNHDKQIYYLATAAADDIKNGTREVAALQELAKTLFIDGQLHRGHEYINAAMQNALECKANMRVMQIASDLSEINARHTNALRKWSGMYALIIVLLGILLLIILIIASQLYQNNKRLKATQKLLNSANQAKETYMSQFLDLSSQYMEKLRMFNKMVIGKISSGQSDELLRLAKDGKLLEESSQDFLNAFDTAFLYLYPDFLSKVNSLMQSGQEITLQPGEKMNTDLRILACIKMGIDDSNRIAGILNYSVNTIYAYRTRIKNRSISRDSLDADIKNI